MTEQWEELKETITELRDNDGVGTQQEVCKFLANYMDVLEKQMTDNTCKGCTNAKECIMYESSMKRCKDYKSEV